MPAGWARKMTHPAYSTTPELAMWISRDRRRAWEKLTNSGLTYFLRQRRYTFAKGKQTKPGWTTTRTVRWFIIPPSTMKAFIFARCDEIWEQEMANWPSSERRPSPWIRYRGLLRASSNVTALPSLPWPFKRSTAQRKLWNSQRIRLRKLRQARLRSK